MPFHSIWCLVPCSVGGGKLKEDFLTKNKIHQELTFNPVSPDDPITSGWAILPWQESKHRSDQYQSILSGVWLFTFNIMTLQYFDHLDLIRSASRAGSGSQNKSYLNFWFTSIFPGICKQVCWKTKTWTLMLVRMFTRVFKKYTLKKR